MKGFPLEGKLREGPGLGVCSGGVGGFPGSPLREMSCDTRLFLRPLPILGLGMVVQGAVLLLLLLSVQHRQRVDPLFYGPSLQVPAAVGFGVFKVCVRVFNQCLQSFPSPASLV